MVTQIEVGFGDTSFGVITLTDSTFTYTGQTAVLERMVTLIQRKKAGIPPGGVIDAILAGNRAMSWAKPVNEKKYNQWHDSSTGQFSSGDGSSVSIGTEMSTAVATHGGFTMTDHMHSGITSGKALSPYPDRSKVIQGVPTAKDVHSWLQKNHDILKLPNHYAGGWFDATTGKTFLDVSIVVKTAQEAHDLSIQYKQRAYYDLDTGSEVRTLSESEAHQA